MEIAWHVKPFGELTIRELYGILRLRSGVFVVEQECVYQDMDGKDEKALHVFGVYGGTVIAYSRLFRAGDYFQEASIGRVVVHPEYRRRKIATVLMRKSIDTINNSWNEPVIRISAQTYLSGFYASLGFKPVSVEYMEDGIPHRSMIWER